MATKDISRVAFNPRKHYDSVRMQQGRVVVDDDWNENERIRQEERRRATLDIIGPQGSPDQGFLVENPIINGKGQIDFDIRLGRLYAGGLALELEQDETYRTQKDWLQQDPGLDPKPTRDRFDLVYLEAWQQPVGAVEDNELFEVALGGPDTSARVRNMRRVKIQPDVGTRVCEDAWKRLIETWNREHKGIIGPTGEKTTDTELTVSLSEGGDPDDLCTPLIKGGYLGADNQAIRVQLVDEDHFTWGMDNAAALYRVRLDTDRKTVTLLNEPKDQAHWPLSGQTVEILPWDAVLPNTQKTAAMLGHLSGVVTSYDPDSKTLTLADPLPAGFGRQWESRDDRTVLEQPETVLEEPWTLPGQPPVYYFMRVWDRGADRTSQPAIHFTPGASVPLGNTGLQVTITGQDRNAGDYWVIAARPQTPNVVVPWELEIGISTHGVRRYYAPLAIIHWRVENQRAVGEVIHDCRQTFLPLTELDKECCVRVDPGHDLHQAIKEVTDNGGGCICLMPGEHVLADTIDLTDCSGIQIRGFGEETWLIVSSKMKEAPAFTLSSSHDISFESFVVISPAARPVWECEGTYKLSLAGMAVSTGLVGTRHPIISIVGRQCHSWRLEDSKFLGPMLMQGASLSDSAISRNLIQGTVRGIDLEYMQRVTVQGNHFSGVRPDLLEMTGLGIAGPTEDADAIYRRLGGMTYRPYTSTRSVEIAVDYVAVDASAAFESDFIDNRFEGSVGLSCADLAENCTVQGNEFLTTVNGTSCGIAHKLRFIENRLGVKQGKSKRINAIQCRLGLGIAGDAVDCHILDNYFANVREGIVFESDMMGKKAITRDYSVNLSAAERVDKKEAKRLLAASEARVKERLGKQRLLGSTTFRIGTCERVIIQGNHFEASQTGIEWSGTKNIIDFRIVDNSFVGCQDVAIQIEPDDLIFFLAEPIDTKVRLISKNRFDVHSGAVRATTGAVRIEKNDIRVRPPALSLVPSIDVMVVAAETVYGLAPLTEATKDKDVPMMRMLRKKAAKAAEETPEGIDAAGFSKAMRDVVLKTHEPNKGDVLADKAFVMTSFAEIGAIEYLPALVNEAVPHIEVDTEGYAVNLSGVQNRVVHNRIYSSDKNHPGGVLFHSTSGEIRDNEVSVPGMGVLLNGQLGLSAAYQGVEIVGNLLASSGISGSNTTVYALAIPSLSPGTITMNGNQFIGSVMIGGDGFSAQGFTRKKAIPREVVHLNAMKYDPPTFVACSISTALYREAAPSVEVPEVAMTVMPLWSADPHADRPVVQFSNNRVIRGWLGILQTMSGTYWTKAYLKKQGHKALLANLTGNVLDYGGAIVGYDVILVGNHSHSRFPIKYRVGGTEETLANIPEAREF